MKDKKLVIHINHPDRYLQNCFKSKDLVDAFIELAEYALTKEPVLLIRTEYETIGVSRPNEKYWFYVSWKDGLAKIKFQHWQQSKQFKKSMLKQYKLACDMVAGLYHNTPETFFTGYNKAVKKEEKGQGNKALEIKAKEISGSEGAQEWVKSCENCYLRQSEKCSSLKGEVCVDYEPAYYISKEEMELWPKEMDASKITKKIGMKQEKYGSK